MMDKEDLEKILVKHKKWLNNKAGGERADLQRADLRYADLRDADLQRANLRHANLQRADLQRADLQGADLQDANLRYADLDFSCFPLWCGSFDIIDDGHIAKQLLSHVARLDIRDEKLAKWVKSIPKEYKNEFCSRHDIKEID